MVRSASAVRTSRRTPTTGSPLVAERALRKLVDENQRLRRELRELRKLERWVHHELLAGLPSRRLFEERLDEELSRAARDPAHRGSLLVVKHMEVVNERPGRAPSEDAVEDTARTLMSVLRASDLCCRTAGDELMILLPAIDTAGARLVVNRLRAAAFRAGARRDTAISLSIGAVSWPDDGQRAGELLDRADRAMYAEQRRLLAQGRRRARSPFALALVK
jgi:diguanylate cyclase (GGDEF)-like protein